TPVPQHYSWRQKPDATENVSDRRNLKDQAEAEHNHYDQVQILFSVEQSNETAFRRPSEQEIACGGKCDLVGKSRAECEEDSRHDQHRHNVALLALVETWRNKSPDLVQEKRDSERDGGIERHLYIDHERRGQIAHRKLVGYIVIDDPR